MRKSRKLIAILATLAMLATLLVPMVGPAAAATTYGVSTVMPVSAGQDNTLSTYLQISMDTTTALASTGSKVVFSLPSSPSGFALKLDTANIKTTGAFAASDVGITPSTINTTPASEFTVTLSGPTNTTTTATTSTISIPITMLRVPGGATGDIKLTASAPPGSVFSNGEIVIATAGSGQVTLAAESVESISSDADQKIGVIDIKENMGGALKDSGSDAAVKLTLPPGFTWDTSASYQPSVSATWGNLGISAVSTNPSTPPTNSLYFTTGNSGRELAIHVPSGAASTQATFLKLTAYINVDESVAKKGDVTITISGAATVSPSSLVVAKYGEYGLSVSALTSPDLVAGKAAQKIGKFQVAEGLKGSLIKDRTITLTLPDGVKWAAKPVIDASASTLAGIDQSAVDNSWQAVGSDGRTIKGTIKFTGSATSTTDAATLVFKDAKVTVSPAFAGNLDVTVGGSQGLTGTITVGKVAAGVNVKASSTPDVKIGLSDQATGDVSITEVAASNINSTITYTKDNASLGTGTVDSDSSNTQAQIVLELPSGVTFSSTPAVSVVEGDLQIDTPKTQNDSRELVIPVKSTSTKPSTIKISGIKLTVDRTVPEGVLVLKVKGTAVNETLDSSGKDTYFPGATTVAKAIIANCVTPAPGEQKSTVVFKVGDTKFTVNGVEQTMDVAPYVKNGRTYVPVRYSAEAVGVAPENILYSGGKVTLLKGDKVVQFTIGSNVMLINGVAVTMDVKAEVTNGRTMLPFRWVAQALGASVDWDPNSQAVTMTL
ncbi:hypothetical protein J2Z49_000159 [Desulfofundulus luciae]|uniref:Copper amine oxidase-like N-terminal domain-containing protein n=1 Tax=Desulfofundulus luciae TaxID=74702 RepID=A0ABU0AYG6_9FIRM|nr:copper amine oxidase N-terminal domain-containing protein [Desulfofundulus luciae]MDQ0285069.1 hypothetical protein [Desulfofundulus luciae]